MREAGGRRGGGGGGGSVVRVGGLLIGTPALPDDAATEPSSKYWSPRTYACHKAKRKHKAGTIGVAVF